MLQSFYSREIDSAADACGARRAEKIGGGGAAPHPAARKP
jgi:hypothetical protein